LEILQNLTQMVCISPQLEKPNLLLLEE